VVVLTYCPLNYSYTVICAIQWLGSLIGRYFKKFLTSMILIFFHPPPHPVLGTQPKASCMLGKLMPWPLISSSYSYSIAISEVYDFQETLFNYKHWPLFHFIKYIKFYILIIYIWLDSYSSLIFSYFLQSWDFIKMLAVKHLLYFLWWDWSLNSGLCTCQAGALPLEPHLQSKHLL
jgi:hypothetical protein